MNYLLISIGHGSSAVLVYNCGANVIGYEQERLSGVKSDSQFPTDAINEIAKNVGWEELSECTVFISHWFNSTGNQTEDLAKFVGNKYITHSNFEFLKSFTQNIGFVSSNFTHHDAHAHSATAFFNSHYDEKVHKMVGKALHTIVADGFGTNEEAVSVYVSYDNGKTQRLLHRASGFEKSLGLLYQYATSFCGMKENQDEYKFLGYESYIGKVLDKKQRALLLEIADRTSKDVSDRVIKCNCDTVRVRCKGVIDFDKLKQVKCDWHSIYDDLIGLFEYEKTDFNTRSIIAVFIQRIVENVLRDIIDYFSIENVMVTGGCFYNVKLNNAVLTHVKGLFCATPLAGDQGAPIGMLQAFSSIAFNYTNLSIGVRDVYHAEKLFAYKGPSIVLLNRVDLADTEIARIIASHIADGKLVNLVEGNMEFGPRALCNTSTLFLPSTANTAANNHMNNRNEVMPCAPVMLQRNAEELFDKDELARVVGSDKFMICTHSYTRPYSLSQGGVMHSMPVYKGDGHYSHGSYTGRPQIVGGKTLIGRILRNLEYSTGAKCIVNTSFNAHGRPIAFTLQDALSNFNYQTEHAKEDAKPMLIVVV